jgi:hypothetical protein
LASPFPPQIQIADQPDPNAGGGGQDPTSQIADALDQIRQALAADGFTDQEKLTLEKVTTLLQGLAATREKEQQAAMGGGPATNFLRRATGA